LRDFLRDFFTAEMLFRDEQYSLRDFLRDFFTAEILLNG